MSPSATASWNSIGTLLVEKSSFWVAEMSVTHLNRGQESDYQSLSW